MLISFFSIPVFFLAETISVVPASKRCIIPSMPKVKPAVLLVRCCDHTNLHTRIISWNAELAKLAALTINNAHVFASQKEAFDALGQTSKFISETDEFMIIPIDSDWPVFAHLAASEFAVLTTVGVSAFHIPYVAACRAAESPETPTGNLPQR